MLPLSARRGRGSERHRLATNPSAVRSLRQQTQRAAPRATEATMSKTNTDLPRADRRKFLKGAALTGAAALAPTTAPAQPAPPRADLKAAAPGPKLSATETLPPA